MRIISCHIENFGKLSNFDMDFNTGLNFLKEDNGWGKSTFAAFIRSMFFGLEGDGKRDDLSCERKRFAPWQGGPFGGKLVFEENGKKYEISRLFGSKANDDIFELRDYDTNLESNDYSENIGEELFSINSESFMKTIFIRQSDCIYEKATDDINAKLGNNTDTIDINRYASAETLLKDALNSFSATRKTGVIARLKEQESSLKAEVMRGENIEDTIRAIEARIHDTKVSIEEVKVKKEELASKLKAASKNEAMKNAEKIYGQLKEEVNAKEEACSIRRQYFKKAIPSKEVLDSWEQASEKIGEYDARISASELSANENAIYTELLGLFNNGVPEEAELNENIDAAKKLNLARSNSLKHSLSEEEEKKLEEYRQSFGEPEIEEAKVLALLTRWNELNQKLSELPYLKREEDEKRGELTKLEKNAGGKFCLALAGAFILASVLTVFFLNNMGRAVSIGIAAVLFAIGLTLVVAGSATASKKKKKAAALGVSYLEIEDSINRIEVSKRELEEDSRAILSSYGMLFSEESIGSILQQLIIKIHEYKALNSKALEAKKSNSFVEEKELSFIIKAFLERFSIYASSSEALEKLTELKGKASHYASLRIKSQKYEEALLARKNQYSALKESLLDYDIEPGMDVLAKVDEVLDVATEYNSLMALLKEARERLEEFVKENEVLTSEDTPTVSESLDELHEEDALLEAKLETLRSNLMADTRTFDEYEALFETYRDNTAELSRLHEEIEVKLKRLDIIAKTEKYLTEAKENMTARYMKPLLTGFGKYYSILSGENASKYKIDANTVITIEELGKQRNTKNLSFGYQDLIGLCMRLAMADCMYKDAKPMLVMDDPFVNLDDKKMEGAKKLLEEVAKDYQILYMTCRENRI